MQGVKAVGIVAVLATLVCLWAWRAQPHRKVANPDDDWDETPPDLATLRTGADRMAGSNAQGANPRTSSRIRKGEEFNPELLPDSVFRHPGKTNRILFEQIFGTVGSKSVAFRALNRHDGSYLFDTEKGWLKFNGNRFVTVGDSDVPAELRQTAPVAKDPATHKARGLAGGDS